VKEVIIVVGFRSDQIKSIGHSNYDIEHVASVANAVLDLLKDGADVISIRVVTLKEGAD